MNNSSSKDAWPCVSTIPQTIPGVIRTFSGIEINIFEPKPEQINIEDIAHALSNQCRFSGHVARFYSVAEHSLHVAMKVEHKHALAALLHDASEAYIVDLPTPIKIVMPEYINIEDRIMKVIAEKFGFEYPLHHSVKRADKEMLEFEWDKLMVNKNWIPESCEAAEMMFLNLFHRIKKI